MEAPSRRSKRTSSALTTNRLFNTDSPITKPDTDIQTFLSLCLANWALYEEPEKRAIISVLPVAYRAVNYDADSKIICPLSSEFIVNDAIIRDQIAQFKRDITDGLYTKTWQERARKAMQERADGKFDRYLAKHTADLLAEMSHCCSDGEDESSDGDYSSKNKTKRTHGKKKAKKGFTRNSTVLGGVSDVDDSV